MKKKKKQIEKETKFIGRVIDELEEICVFESDEKATENEARLRAINECRRQFGANNPRYKITVEPVAVEPAVDVGEDL